MRQVWVIYSDGYLYVDMAFPDAHEAMMYLAARGADVTRWDTAPETITGTGDDSRWTVRRLAMWGA